MSDRSPRPISLGGNLQPPPPPLPLPLLRIATWNSTGHGHLAALAPLLSDKVVTKKAKDVTTWRILEVLREHNCRYVRIFFFGQKAQIFEDPIARQIFMDRSTSVHTTYDFGRNYSSLNKTISLFKLSKATGLNRNRVKALREFVDL